MFTYIKTKEHRKKVFFFSIFLIGKPVHALLIGYLKKRAAPISRWKRDVPSWSRFNNLERKASAEQTRNENFIIA